MASQSFYQCALIDSSTFFEGILIPEESSLRARMCVVCRNIGQMGNNRISPMNRAKKYPILKVSKYQRGKKEKEPAYWLV